MVGLGRPHHSFGDGDDCLLWAARVIRQLWGRGQFCADSEVRCEPNEEQIKLYLIASNAPQTFSPTAFCSKLLVKDRHNFSPS